MATQRVLIFSVGGETADRMWQAVCRWSDARTTRLENEWSSENWTEETRVAIDAFVETVKRSAFLPPVLYRAEYIDCWSMSAVYEMALVKRHPDYSRRLMTGTHQIIATWVQSSERIILEDHSPAETRWLYNHLNEAFEAWGEISERRLVVLVRSVIDGRPTDEEVVESMKTIPAWWAETP
ncbi:MAG: hypothetical protein ACYC4U_33905 [Pirellulaceae bacterium]